MLTNPHYIWIFKHKVIQLTWVINNIEQTDLRIEGSYIVLELYCHNPSSI